MKPSVANFEMLHPVCSLLECSSSLFIGIRNGDILEWENPGKIKQTFKGHTNDVLCLKSFGETLWSSSLDKTVRLWNFLRGECVKVIQTLSIIEDLVQWKGQMVFKDEVAMIVWNAEGECLYEQTPPKPSVYSYSVIVWKDYLCGGDVHEGKISLWEEFNMKNVRNFLGHTDGITCFASTENLLLSASYDSTIRFWNEAGECVKLIRHQDQGRYTLLMRWGKEVVACDSMSVIMRMNLDGEVLETYGNGNYYDSSNSVVVWRGVLFSGGPERTILQWTQHVWATTTHGFFSLEIRKGIKTMMMVASSQHFPTHAITIHILFTIFQFYASASVKTDITKS